MAERQRLRCPPGFPTVHLSPQSPDAHQPGRAVNPILADFTEASLHSHGWLHHWQRVTELKPWLLSHP